MAAILKDGELTLSGDVGDAWFDDSFTYADVVMVLAEIEDDADLTVRLNSGGGIATEGAAIHALLDRRKGRTDVVVEGIAASAASLIAMAGKTVTMANGAIMMIHDPSGITFGTSDDHAKSIEGLEALATSYARVYAAKSGRTSEECRAVMKEETWLTAEQAVEQGFADKSGSDKAEAVAAFDYRLYAHAPKRLTALAKKNGWSHEAAGLHAATAAQPGPKEQSMTDKERADQLAAELAELKKNQTDTATATAAAVKADRERRAAIMAFDETKGREKLAERLATSDMSIDDIKATLADAPQATAAADEGTNDFERRRMNADGLNGGKKTPAGTPNQARASADAVAKMKLLTGTKETA